VAIGRGESGKIVSVGKIGKSLSHSIDNAYLVDGLQYNLLTVPQLCDRGNHVEFSSDQCLIPKANSSSVVLRGKRHNNVCKVCVLSLSENHLTCLSSLDEDIIFWHKRLGYISLSLLNNLVSKDPVVRLPSIKYNNDKVCNACARGK